MRACACAPAQAIEWDHGVRVLRDGLRPGDPVFLPLRARPPAPAGPSTAAAAAAAAAELWVPSGPRMIRGVVIGQVRESARPFRALSRLAGTACTACAGEA